MLLSSVRINDITRSRGEARLHNSIHELSQWNFCMHEWLLQKYFDHLRSGGEEEEERLNGWCPGGGPLSSRIVGWHGPFKREVEEDVRKRDRPSVVLLRKSSRKRPLVRSCYKLWRCWRGGGLLFIPRTRHYLCCCCWVGSVYLFGTCPRRCYLLDSLRAAAYLSF